MSSHASGSSSPLYLSVVEFSLKPFGICVSRMDRVKHSAPHGSMSSSVACSSEYSSRAAHLRLPRLTLFCVMSSRASRRLLLRLLPLSLLSCFLFLFERLHQSSLLSLSSGELGSMSGVCSRGTRLAPTFLGAEAVMASFIILRAIVVLWSRPPF